MRFLSTFSGIGGLEKGLEDAGWECAGQVELDEACQHWLGVHWPHVPKWRDIKTLTGDAVRARIGHIDALVGGPPCQPASVAGKRRGSSDERWLWPDFLRLGRELSPKWILAENPSGIVTLKPHGLDWILEELEAAGYQSFPVVVGADDVGAPHRRKRVWIVGRLGLADADSSRERDADELRRIEWASRAGASDAGRSGWPVGSPTGAGLEGQRPHAGEPQEPEPRHAMRWPSRPGEPQHEWEAPRLAHTERSRRNRGQGAEDRNEPDRADAGRLQSDREPSGGHCDERDGDGCRVHGPIREGDQERDLRDGGRLLSERSEDREEGLADRESLRLEGRPARERPEARATTGRGSSGDDGMADSTSEPPRGTGQPRQDPDPREPESPMGSAVDGLSDRMAGLTSAHRREALKALGNAVSPPCAYYLGRAIMSMAKVSA